MRKNKVDAVKLSQRDQVVLVLACDEALRMRTRRESFPSAGCKRALRGVQRRLMAGLVNGAKVGA